MSENCQIYSAYEKWPNSLDNWNIWLVWLICDNTCLREAFALFDADRQEEITVPELGKVRESQRLLQLEAGNLASRTSKNCISSPLSVTLWEILFKAVNREWEAEISAPNQTRLLCIFVTLFRGFSFKCSNGSSAAESVLFVHFCPQIWILDLACCWLTSLTMDWVKQHENREYGVMRLLPINERSKEIDFQLMGTSLWILNLCSAHMYLKYKNPNWEILHYDLSDCIESKNRLPL